MDNLTYNRIKNSKPFVIKDVLLYTLILVFTATLFLIPLLSKNNRNGFIVNYEGKEIFRYYYSEKEYSVTPFNGRIEITEEEFFSTVKICFGDSDTEYNILLIDNENNSVVMKDSTCSKTKDCTYSPKVSDNGAIICAPHKLKITPVGGNKELVTG